MKDRTSGGPFRVVITGAPCAGKTGVWRFLAAALPGSVPIPEAATELILAGSSEFSLGLEGFQREVYERQRTLEEEGAGMGSLLLCDRGLPDGLAYFPDLFARMGVSEGALLKRYAVIIQVQVILDPDTYLLHCHSNPARHEAHDRAVDLERRIRGIYAAHPDFFFLRGSLEEKQQAALRVIRDRVAALRPDLFESLNQA